MSSPRGVPRLTRVNSWLSACLSTRRTLAGNLPTSQPAADPSAEVDAVQAACLVVRDDQAAVGGDHHARGAAPAASLGVLKTLEEVLGDDGLRIGEVDAQQFGFGGRLAVPGAGHWLRTNQPGGRGEGGATRAIPRGRAR